ncbi:Tho complex subunit 7 [Toxoplasma gondii TgCatPRC2]|uniref:Tho complex subunit 7 n=12 Tax=Toxoplasma gondii TaxID=5811 RepID=A0A125YWG9_TOXGV|nr:hypothetical protein TGME49_294780 [Toxoplasma gondii ME49]EPR57685.1 hypothetical protein TGGT1_294780 [Toxoplasma gondii GT1]ESS29198.1 Tho complex subunit 7 [Toxoplasma gondii VEG]KAF4646192.1 hypothetical protein TGRH88_019790 [Toxoplasma gondii]KFG35328.1 Tho complex subunit 7 [Toxoplasma gondii p89]KFG37345.1 Tho complex subunit 7 [Toxoplasma gondii GAB2-2007-GAL-DOM2]KFG46689.1 Tho complex subunit 7 [Toxoplasma gondii FOU]KFH14270.1 Tho complex subunit 7 [Toxoplasma gondii MAS]KYF|eukprot:XP_018638573.1 hypothetical protein TGME49_294780 [Toxoplasma gondii ME49]
MEGAKSSSATNSRQGVFPKSQPGDKSTSNSTAPSSSREQQRNKNEQANRVKGGGLASSGPAANGGGGTPRWGSGTSASKSCTRESSDAAADPGSRQSPRPSDKNTKVFEDKRGRTLSVNSNQPGMKGTDRLSAHSEEDLLKGLTLQAIWSENVELTSLMNAALKIARLSPTASDLDWNESYHTFLQLFSMSKARLARQKSILQARQRDLEDILADERSIRQSVEDCERAIVEAQKCLAKAKRHRRNREQYEALALEVSKKASVADLKVAQAEEMERKAKAEKKAKFVEEQVATRQRQTQVVLKAASDLLQASQNSSASAKAKS